MTALIAILALFGVRAICRRVALCTARDAEWRAAERDRVRAEIDAAGRGGPYR